MISNKAFLNSPTQATQHPVIVVLQTPLADVRRPLTQREYPVQGVFTSVVGEEGPPASLAMLRSSRFIAYAERTGRGPLQYLATSTVQSRGTNSAQPPAEWPAAAPPSSAGAATEAFSGTAPNGVEVGWSRSQASEPQDAKSDGDTSAAAHEAALRAEGSDVAADHGSASENSRGGSPAGSDQMELQLPPMARCASPPQSGQRAPDVVGQRHDALSAAGPVTLSDTVHIGSSCSAAMSPHRSLSSAASPRGISHAILPPPPSISSVDTSAPPAEFADMHTDEFSSASARQCDAIFRDKTSIALPGSNAGGSDGVDRAAAYDPASAHSGVAVATTAELQCASVHAAMATCRPPSERAQDLTTANEQLLHDLRHSEERYLSDHDGGALPLGGGLQYADEQCSPPESGAVPNHGFAGKRPVLFRRIDRDCALQSLCGDESKHAVLLMQSSMLHCTWRTLSRHPARRHRLCLARAMSYRAAWSRLAHTISGLSRRGRASLMSN